MPAIHGARAALFAIVPKTMVATRSLL